MNLTLRLQLTAMAMCAGVAAWLVIFLGPVTPRANLLAATAIIVLFMAVWLAMLIQWWRRLDPSVPRGYRDFDFAVRVLWVGNIGALSALALLMPYADEAFRLMVIICLMGPVAAASFATISNAPERGRSSVLPFVIPAAVAVYYAWEWDRFGLSVICAMAGLSVLIAMLRRALKDQLDELMEARRLAVEARAEVEAQRDARVRFLASASHDLGQPLQSARLFFDQAIRGPDPSRRQRAALQTSAAFEVIDRQLQRMNDHLRLESGDLTARQGEVEIGPLLARIASLVEVAATQAGVRLDVMASGLVCQADADLLERAISNLVDNALRHAKASRLLIGARRHGDHIRVWVIDNGVGIPEPDVRALFDDYVQGSNHGDEVRGGFGLGLASARRMMELMGGTVGLARQRPSGAWFFLEMLRAPALR